MHCSQTFEISFNLTNSFVAKNFKILISPKAFRYCSLKQKRFEFEKWWCLHFLRSLEICSQVFFVTFNFGSLSFKMNREGLHHQNLFLILIFFNIPIMMAIGTISPCCNQLVINGTLNMDPWYQNMMGIFTLFEELPWVSYEKRGDISGKFPVYVHYFEDFVSHPQRRPPPRAFLYFYVNEMENYPEMECVERGCWIISRNCININQLNKNNIIFWRYVWRYPRKLLVR